MTVFTDLSPNQQRVFLDLEQVYGAYRAAEKQCRQYAGWMVWKKAGGNEYLYHAFDRTGGAGEGLGRRSAKTEAHKAKFDAEKKRLTDLVAGLKARLDEHAIATRAYKLRRVPTIAAKVLRAIDERDLLGQSMIVVGTNALFAYEAAAGSQFLSDYTATQDLDVLWEARTAIELEARDRIEPDGFMGILKSVDKMFTRNEERTFQAVSRDGYLVDLLKPQGATSERMSTADKIDPMELEGQQWLLDCERFEQCAVAEDGYPVRIVCPDPRYFVLHKLWLADRKDRRAPKARRDRLQAQAVTELVTARLPNLPFTDIATAVPAALKPYIKRVPQKNTRSP